ncbi:MAG: aminoglycoside phosphotransferase family protein [Chloroflexota bacterium]|nr:aminoglycoside phosphotransferase family protein [Chloroflexota bacterium]
MATTLSNTFALIPHPDASRVLMLKQGHSWALPHCAEDEPAAINQAIQRQLGLEVTILYCADEQDTSETEVQRIYAVDNHSASDQVPAYAAWIRFEDLSERMLAEPRHYTVLESWFHEMQGSDDNELRRPWRRIGWYTILTSWLEEQLARLGYQATEVEQVEVSDWSYILRIHTTGSTLYLKCCDPAFPHEVALTATLSRLWPTVVPSVLAIESRQNWMLMQDAGTLLSASQERVHDSACWTDILTSYIRLQKEAIGYRDTLLLQGCPDRRLEKLPSLVAEALVDTDMLRIGKSGGITEEDAAQLRVFLPQLKGMCDELASYGIPETLHHDDLHSGNIMVQEDHYIFFDWAESFIAHPFYSLAVILRYAGYGDLNGAQQEYLRDVYLEAWTSYAPIERLREAFQIAQKLGILGRGLTWYQYIRSLEPKVRQKYAGEWPYWLQLFLGTAD